MGPHWCLQVGLGPVQGLGREGDFFGSWCSNRPLGSVLLAEPHLCTAPALVVSPRGTTFPRKGFFFAPFPGWWAEQHPHIPHSQGPAIQTLIPSSVGHGPAGPPGGSAQGYEAGTAPGEGLRAGGTGCSGGGVAPLASCLQQRLHQLVLTRGPQRCLPAAPCSSAGDGQGPGSAATTLVLGGAGGHQVPSGGVNRPRSETERVKTPVLISGGIAPVNSPCSTAWTREQDPISSFPDFQRDK